MSAGTGGARDCLAEFDSAADALGALRSLRERGYTRLELHAPYEVAGAAELLDLPRPRYLPRAVLLLAGVGACSGYAVQWHSSTAYPQAVVGARPIHAPPAFAPVTFELGVLLGAFAAFFGLFVRRPLLRLWQPLFEVQGFERASIDRYWVRVDAMDPRFAPDELRELLGECAPLRIEYVPE